MKDNRTGWKTGLLLVLSLVFTSLGQFYFACRRKYVWDGVFFWGVAILLFVLLLEQVRRRGREQSGWKPLAWFRQRWRRVLAVVGGSGLSLSAAWLAREWPPTADFDVLLWLWLIGCSWFLLAFVPSFSVLETGRRLRHWIDEKRVGLAGLAVLLLAALLVRGVALGRIPANLGGDEGTQGVAALKLVRPPMGNPFSTGWYGVPTMSFLAYGLAMRVFGETVAGLRALSVLIGTATVWTTFLLARELWGARTAWLAAGVLACAHFHLHFSRLASNQIADGLFMTLALWLLVRGLRDGRAIYFALAGGVVGLGWYGYFGARLVGVVVFCYLVWRQMRNSGFLAHHGRRLLILLGAALVVLAPLLFHYTAHPETMDSRFQQVSIFASGWLVREQEITGRSAADLLLQQCWKAISAFNYTLDPTFWYRPSIPLLDSVSGALFVLGLVWTVVHWRKTSSSLLLIWFGLALVLGWVMTENPPSSMRMTNVAPALALFVALGLERLVDLGQRCLTSGRRWLWYGVAGLLLAGIVALNLVYYFRVYTPTRVYGNPTAEIATELGRYLARQEDDRIVCFHAPPAMYWSFGTLRFMARGVEGHDVPPIDGEGLSACDVSRGARFVFLPERLNELNLVRARYPGGAEISMHSDADGRLLFVLYEVTPR